MSFGSMGSESEGGKLAPGIGPAGAVSEALCSKEGLSSERALYLILAAANQRDSEMLIL